MSSEGEALRPIFADIVSRLQADDVVDKLYEIKILTHADHEELSRDISLKSDMKGVNRRILRAVRRGPAGSAFKFAEIVKTSQPDLADEILKALGSRFRRWHSLAGMSSSTITMPVQEDVTVHPSCVDVDPPLTSSSAPNQSFLSSMDAAVFSMPNPPMEERVAELERQLKEAVSCVKKLSLHICELSPQMEKLSSRIEMLSSQMEKHSSQMEKHPFQREHTACTEEPSLLQITSPLRKCSSCLEEQTLLTEDLSSKTQFKVLQTAPLLHDNLTLQPEEIPDLPLPTACATAVTIGRKVYVCGGRCDNVEAGRQVHVYCLNVKTWTTLPELAPQYRCEAIAINNQLVLIGGREASRTITNMVSTWTGQRWQQDIPAMPTKRVRPGVIMYDKYVIVVGGMSDHNRALLSSIDILDTSVLQWWTPANFQLPLPMYALDIAVCSSGMYVAAAIIDLDITNNEKTPSNDAWQLPLSVLEEVLTLKKKFPQRFQWKKIAPTPNNHSTLVKSSIHPVAVGGAVRGDQSGCNSTRSVSVYNPIRNRWFTVGQLLESRARCAVVCVSESSFLVCGGYSDTREDPQPRISSGELLNYHI